MQIYLANPRGFCAGVDRAIDIVERAVALFGAPMRNVQCAVAEAGAFGACFFWACA